MNEPLTVNHSSVIFMWFSRIVVKEGFCCNAHRQKADVACCRHLVGVCGVCVCVGGGGCAGGYKMCMVSLTCCVLMHDVTDLLFCVSMPDVTDLFCVSMPDVTDLLCVDA